MGWLKLAGAICSVPAYGGWCRGMIVGVVNDKECDVKFVDYGGYCTMPISSLRQIRWDFMTLPFQSSECYMSEIKPINEGKYPIY